MEVKSQNTKIWNNAEHLRKDSNMSVFATEFIQNNGRPHHSFIEWYELFNVVHT